MIGKKSKLAVLTLAVVAAVSAAGCGVSGPKDAKPAASAAAEQKPLQKMRVAYSTSLCEASTIIAYEKGYFKDEGIDAEMVNVDGASETDALGTLKVDGMQTLVSKVIQPIQNGLPVKITAGLHTGCVKVEARNDGSVSSIADLRGKKVGVGGIGDTGAVILQRALLMNHIGVKPGEQEVEFVVVEKSSLAAALQSGQVDAIAVTDPTATISEKQYGFKPILDTAKSPEFKNEYCCSAMVTSKFAAEHPDLAKGFTKAVMKGAAYIGKHPEEVAQLLHDKKYIAGDVQQNIELLKSYSFIPSATGGYKALEDATAQLGEIGLVKKVDPKELADKAFLKFDDLPDTPEL